MVKRKGIVVYFKHNKVLSKIKSFNIHITYINKLGKYLTGYVSESEFEEIKSTLKKLKLIKHVESSLVEMESLSFAG